MTTYLQQYYSEKIVYCQSLWYNLYICLLETENCDEEKYCNKNHRFFAFRNERYNFDFRLWQKNDIADDLGKTALQQYQERQGTVALFKISI